MLCCVSTLGILGWILTLISIKIPLLAVFIIRKDAKYVLIYDVDLIAVRLHTSAVIYMQCVFSVDLNWVCVSVVNNIFYIAQRCSTQFYDYYQCYITSSIGRIKTPISSLSKDPLIFLTSVQKERRL